MHQCWNPDEIQPRNFQDITKKVYFPTYWPHRDPEAWPPNGCHETLHRPPKWVYFEYWNKTVFVTLLVRVPSVVQLNKLNRPMVHWQSTVLRTVATNHTSKSDRRPTGLPRLRSAVADYAASACITGVNWLNMSIQSFFVPDRPIFGAGADGAVFRTKSPRTECPS